MKGKMGDRHVARRKNKYKKKSTTSGNDLSRNELMSFEYNLSFVYVETEMPAGDARMTVLRVEQDSCHVWDPLLDRSQENQSFASTERHRAAVFVCGTAE